MKMKIIFLFLFLHLSNSHFKKMRIISIILRKIIFFYQMKRINHGFKIVMKSSNKGINNSFLMMQTCFLLGISFEGERESVKF